MESQQHLGFFARSNEMLMVSSFFSGHYESI